MFKTWKCLSIVLNRRDEEARHDSLLQERAALPLVPRVMTCVFACGWWVVQVAGAMGGGVRLAYLRLLLAVAGTPLETNLSVRVQFNRIRTIYPHNDG